MHFVDVVHNQVPLLLGSVQGGQLLLASGKGGRVALVFERVAGELPARRKALERVRAYARAAFAPEPGHLLTGRANPSRYYFSVTRPAPYRGLWYKQRLTGPGSGRGCG